MAGRGGRGDRFGRIGGVGGVAPLGCAQSGRYRLDDQQGSPFATAVLRIADDWDFRPYSISVRALQHLG